MIEIWRGLRVTVMGLGVFGGGLGVTRWLLRQGAQVTVTDLKTEAQLGPSVAALASQPVRWRLGRHEAEDFTDADVVVASPAVPRSSPFLRAAEEAGRVITSEMNLFFERCPSRILGITGSNGKTTTTSLTYEILMTAGRRAWLGGNIGLSLLDALEEISPADWTVLELSSFQLEDLGRFGLGPDLAVVTNLTPNHLDRHGDMASYTAAKMNILRHLRPGGHAVLNRADPAVWAWAGRVTGSLWAFCLNPSEQIPGAFSRDGWLVAFQPSGKESALLAWPEFRLPGSHNRANAQAAAAAALAVGVPESSIAPALRAFRGVPHRLELVAEIGGVRFFNDSKATTPESAIVALNSFSERVILLAGGYDKKLPLASLGQAIAERAKRVVLMGESARALERTIREHSRGGERPDIHHVVGLEEAVTLARGTACAGDVVLLSPGFASYGMFNNYVERGDQFRRLVLGQ